MFDSVAKVMGWRWLRGMIPHQVRISEDFNQGTIILKSQIVRPHYGWQMTGGRRVRILPPFFSPLLLVFSSALVLRLLPSAGSVGLSPWTSLTMWRLRMWRAPGPERQIAMSDKMPENVPDRMSEHIIICQVECQVECQIEWQIEYQVVCENICQV